MSRKRDKVESQRDLTEILHVTPGYYPIPPEALPADVEYLAAKFPGTEF